MKKTRILGALMAATLGLTSAMPINATALAIPADRTSPESRYFFKDAFLIKNDHGYTDTFHNENCNPGLYPDRTWARYSSTYTSAGASVMDIIFEYSRKGNQFNICVPHEKDDEAMIKSIVDSINPYAKISRDATSKYGVFYVVEDNKLSEESVADAKELCKKLKAAGLVKEFSYSGNESDYGVSHQTFDEFRYYAAKLGDDGVEKISAYLNEKGIEFKINDIPETLQNAHIIGFDFGTTLTTQKEVEDRFELLMDIYNMGYDTMNFGIGGCNLDLTNEEIEEAYKLYEEVPELIYDEQYLGDVNGTETVDISDAILAKCYILNSDKYPIAEEQMLYGDVIGNNGINQQDALAIQQYAVGLIDTF
ncbi:MAG: dockerin type I repeat-containing protein [Ruminococcus sp.]|nr:dockerin type I repeat-containing protein [Ruminococcus sp.]